jgi:hypothetical protein
MIRLTVLYNLPPGSDEAAFLSWRLGEHQDANAAMPEVRRTDFGIVREVWPPDREQPYRFMTVVEWPDRASYERGFLDPQVQADLQTNLARLHAPLFLITEILADSTIGGP